MRKILKMMGVAMFVTLLVTSCASSVESDAKKVANIQCEVQDATMRIMQGDASVQKEMQKLSSKLEKLNKEMLEKYSSLEEQNKFAKAVANALGDCNK